MKRVASITNERKEPISFWLEPWAEQFAITAGSTLELQFECPESDFTSPDVHITDSLFVYWFGSRCRVKVFLDGTEVTSPASWSISAP
jgi:hypothetical protein